MSERDAAPLSEGKAEWGRILLLIVILVAIVAGVMGVTVHVLYSTAVAEGRERLLETARSEARLIEAVARYNARLLGPGADATTATLSQVVDAHGQYEGFGTTGEFTLARRVEDQIFFLLSHRHFDLDMPQPVPFDSEIAEPMRLALQGETGTIVGLDYRGVLVLAAHEPVAELDWGIVAKIDLAEVRAPFLRAGWIALGPALAAILFGTWLFVSVTRPIVRRAGQSEQRYRDLIEMMPDGLSIQDVSRSQTYVNDRFCEIVGHTREELIGHRTDEYLTKGSREEFARQMAQREHGAAESYQVTFVRSDGSLVDVLMSPAAIHDARGRYAGSFVVVSDISQLKRVEADLRREKEQAQRYFDLAGVIFVLLTREGRIGLINRRGVEILGYDESEELVGRNWFDTCVPEANRAEVDGVFGALLRREFDWTEYYENPVRTRDGAERIIAWHSRPIENEAGEIEAILSSGEDVTDRRRADERFRLAAEVASDLIYEWDVRANDLHWYGDINEALGYEPGTIAPTIEAWIDLIHPEDVARLTDSMERHRTSIEPIHEEYRVRDADGEWRYWLDRGSPVLGSREEPIRWIGACVDVTELRRNQEALTRRATQLEVVRSLGERMSSILDLASLFDSVTRLLHERFGYYHADVFLVDGEFAVFQAGSNAAVSARWRERGQKYSVGRTGMIGWVAGSGEPLLANDVAKEPHFVFDEFVPETKSELTVPVVYEGEIIGVLDIQSNERNAFGPDDLQLVAALCNQLATAIMNARLYADVQRELSERVQVEQALRRSEHRYRSLFDNAVLGIYQTTPDGRILAANPALVRMLGYDSFEELADRNLEKDGYHPDYSRERFKQRMERNGVVVSERSAWTHRDGRTVYVRENARAIRDDEGRILYYEGTIEDITEQREAERAKEVLEAQLIHNQKLESIGTLASGVAHEINNPLTGIINYAQLIESHVTEDALLGYAAGIIREGQRVAGIVKNLLSFSRQDKERHSPAAVADIVDVVVSLIGTVVRRDRIDLRVEIPDGLPKIECRSQQIQQVLLNLVTNARDALNQRYPGHHEDKILHIWAEPREVDGVNWIRLCVEDHGLGIPDDVKERIFDPFFTTKPRDEGTGLGLSISHGIVRDHGGTLAVETEPGITRFVVDLPIQNGWKTPGAVSFDEEPKGEAVDGEGADRR